MHYQIPNGQEMILKREDRPEILGYLSKHWLCEASEKLLLKRGIHAEIKAYIKSTVSTTSRKYISSSAATIAKLCSTSPITAFVTKRSAN